MKGHNVYISGRKVGDDSPPLIIAEMSGNHNQSLRRALEIVEAAASSGVHALKIQTYTPNLLTLDVKERDFLIQDKKSLWYGQSLYDLYGKAFTPWDWHEKIIKRSVELGMLCFSTPVDESSVDFLENLQVPCYKVGSFELTHIPLLKRIAACGKPMILSTGMGTVREIAEAVDIVRSTGNHDLILMKCTSTYPADPKHSNIATIPHMRALFNCEVGLSDHTLGIGVAVASIAFGASVIEKHFTLHRADGGVDSAFSIEPHEMKMLVEESVRAWQSIGETVFGPSEAEHKSLAFRRSLYVARDISSGERFTKENVRIIRPGHGLAPKFFEIVIGRVANRDLKKGTPISWDVIS